MNLNDAKKRIQTYLKSGKTWPIIVDVQTRQDVRDITEYFKIGENTFPDVATFCAQDGLLKLDELYSAVSGNNGDTFLTEITGFLKILGEIETKKALNTLITTNISGHVVVITYQCKNYLKFPDPRISESGRLVIVDGVPDTVTDICFISHDLSDAFPDSFDGVQKIGYVIENVDSNNAYIATDLVKTDFSMSVFHLTQLSNAYDIICSRDPKTNVVPQSFGKPEQWNYALKEMGGNGNWGSVIEKHFGSEMNLANSITSYSTFSKQKKWLYYIAASICGVSSNEYLQLAVNNSSNSDEFIKSIFRTILTIDKSQPRFIELYEQRKSIIQNLKDVLAETMDYCKVLSVRGEDAVYYLTDLSQPEKERVIFWLDSYGEHYDTDQLISIFRTVYPDLASYLTKFRFRDSLLDTYFEKYKYQKVINRIVPTFEALVDEQSLKMEFVSVLPPRTSVVEKLDVENSKAFFVDALGVEYLGFIQEKCNEYGLSASITCARCELPSLTEYNKEFVKTLEDKGCKITDIKSIDEIKHHGEDNFDYEKEKKPVYLISELEIINDLLKKIRVNILGGQYEKALILSDHGASRLAVLHETENIWSMATSGVHSGRCCMVSDIDSKPSFAIEEAGYWVLTNYDRFKGGRKANVEVHGGASLEEVAVPIITVTQKKSDIEAFIVDGSKEITLGAMEHATVRIFVSIKSNNIAVKIDGNFFDAVPTNDQYIYSVDLPDYCRKGKYELDIYNGSEKLASGQEFEIKKKGMAEVNLFG